MRRHLPLVAVALALGCDSPATGPRATAKLSLTVTQTGIEGAPGTSGERRVRLTIEHEGGRGVALSGCPRPPSVRVERYERGAWRDVGSSGLVCVAIHTIQTVALTTGGSIETELSTGTAGRYRYIVPIGPDASAPEWELRSAPIDIP